MRYFFDNCLSPHVVAALNELRRQEDEDYEVVHLSAKFPRNAKDETWIGELGKEGGWVIVSGDPRITRGKVERAAWLESQLTAFFLGKGWGNLRLWDHTWRLVKWWPKLVAESGKVKPGTGYIVPIKGEKLELVL